MVFPILVIESHLGTTDCSGCRFFRRGRYIFAQREQDPDMHGHVKFVALPLKVATFSTVDAAQEALARIDEARRLQKEVVDLKDLGS